MGMSSTAPATAYGSWSASRRATYRAASPARRKELLATLPAASRSPDSGLFACFALVNGAEADAEEVEDDPQNCQGGDGDDHASHPRESPTDYHGQEDQDGVYV